MATGTDWRTIDWREAARRLLRPTLDPAVIEHVRRLADDACPPACRRNVRRSVTTLRSSGLLAEAWEAVAPPEWVGSSDRSFFPFKPMPVVSSMASDLSDAHGRDFFGEYEVRPGPTSLELIAALAAGASAVWGAEELAREYARRSEAWRFEPRRRPPEASVAWGLLEPTWRSRRPRLIDRASDLVRSSIDYHLRANAAHDEDAIRSDEAQFMRDTGITSSVAIDQETTRRCGPITHSCAVDGHEHETAMRTSMDVLLYMAWWNIAVGLDLRVRARTDGPLRSHHLIGARFRELPCPFDPVVRLVDLGFVLVGESDRRVAIGVPWAEPLITGPTWRSLGLAPKPLVFRGGDR